MAPARGKQNQGERGEAASRSAEERRGAHDEQNLLSELARRAVALGLSGLFFTESTIRKALGDTLPKEWSEFAVDQSERTRKEFMERLTFEIGQTLENVDIAAVLADLMRGRTLDITAQIRLIDENGDEAPEHGFRVRLKGDPPAK